MERLKENRLFDINCAINAPIDAFARAFRIQLLE